MSKIDSLAELRKHIENWLLPNVNNILILINTEENRLSAVYDGRRMCRIYKEGECVIRLEFEKGFYNDEEFVPEKRWCYIENLNSFVLHISNSIMYYKKKKQEVKNMAKRRFIVEKMEVEQKCGEPDVINMTVRKDPDGLIPTTGEKLKKLIESLDPDKLSSDNRINVNIDNNTVEKQIYMMSARGSGKTRWVSEQLKNAWPCKNNIKNNIKDVIFNDPATIVFWVDGSKTVVKCQPGETFDPEKGLAMAISKKVLGNDYGYYETFAKHVGRYNKKHKEK